MSSIALDAATRFWHCVAAMPNTDPETPAQRYLPTITLVLLVLALLGGWWLFPRLQAYMTEQDCIASGRTNCVRLPTAPAP